MLWSLFRVEYGVISLLHHTVTFSKEMDLLVVSDLKSHAHLYTLVFIKKTVYLRHTERNRTYYILS